MFLIHRAVLRPKAQAASLPNNYLSFQQRGISFRMGEVSMVAGPPGSGKSSLALAIAVRAGVPTLYLSADTTRETVEIRLVSMLTGLDQNEAEAAMNADREWASQVLEQVRHISFDDHSSPTLQRIELLIDAHRELHGCDPQLIIIDNAGDVVTDGMDEFGALRALMRDIRHYARNTGAATIVLHHTREGLGNPCPPQDAIHGRIAQVPALILTLNSASNPGFIGVAPVKNRHASPCPYGDNPVWLSYDASRMAITDMQEVAA